MSLSWSKWYKLQFFLWTACKTVWVEVLWNKCKNTKECPRGELKQLILFLPYHQSVMFYFTARLHLFFFFYLRVMSSILVKFALSAHFQSILYSNQWQIYLKLIIFLIILQLSKHVGDDNVSYIYSVSSFVFNI